MLQLMIEFLGQGQAAAAGAAQGIGRALDKAAQSASKLQAPLEKVQSAMSGAANRLLSVVRTGMAGTTEMNQLAFQIQRVHREIANVFAPWIRKTIELLNTLRQKLQSLTGAQQEAIRNWVLAGAAVFALTKILARFVAVWTALRSLRGPGAAGGEGSAGGGVAGVLGAVGKLAVGLGALLLVSEEGREALADLFKTLQPLIDLLAKLAAGFVKAIGAIADFIAGILKWLFTIERDFLHKQFGGSRQQAESGLRKIAEGRRGELTAEEKQSIFTSGKFIGDLEKLTRERARELMEKTEGEGPKKDALTEARSGREDPREMIRRIQESALKNDVPKKQLTVQEQIRDMIKGMKEGFLKPAPGGPAPGLGV